MEAQRAFNLSYIILDTVFIVAFLLLLFFKKRYATLIFALLGGLLYFIVDYGIFHLATHSRTITGGSMFWVLLWMSMSYGITNFAWIWLCLKKDKHTVEWLTAILLWWFVCPLLAETFGANSMRITIKRTTGAYHGYMAIILAVSYFAVLVYNLFCGDKTKRFRILWLMAIGITVQLGWEASLLIGGIRSTEIVSIGDKLRVLAINSLLETNLGLPAIYLIYLTYSSRFTETLKRRPDKLTLLKALQESNNARFAYREKSATNGYSIAIQSALQDSAQNNDYQETPDIRQ